MFIEKSILDHLGAFISTTNYKLSPQEEECKARYERSPVTYGVLNFLIWGSIAVYTLDFRALLGGVSPKGQAAAVQDVLQKNGAPKSVPVAPLANAPKPRLTISQRLAGSGRPVQPLWISVWGLVAITGGVFAGTYFASRFAAKQCLQCFVDVEDKKSELYKATRMLLKDYHPTADAFFAKEKQSTTSNNVSATVADAT
ncbi:hypothetical protein BC832DRAFT_538368 [Gaertneriomyces semiglobifer]|nr:hypothetical protein BC832DRAFT_538368 [Gaertneriomyces semiglobifer]